MRTLLSYVLVGTGLFCAGAAVFIVAAAEAHQPPRTRHWTESGYHKPDAEVILPPGAVAKMHFDRLNRDVFVWGDENASNFAKGPVWLRLTQSFASIGNTVVAGHRDTHFLFLKDAKVGDVFEVDENATHLTFRITSIRIVPQTDRALLAPAAEKTVTLVTCYPFYTIGRANHRMILRAELINQ